MEFHRHRYSIEVLNWQRYKDCQLEIAKEMSPTFAGIWTDSIANSALIFEWGVMDCLIDSMYRKEAS